MFRVLLFFLFLGVLAFILVWLIRYFLGGNLRYKTAEIKKKIIDDEVETTEKIVDLYGNKKTIKKEN